MSNLLLELAADALDADVEVAFPTGRVGAGPHPILFPLHNDFSPLHLLKSTDHQVGTVKKGVPWVGLDASIAHSILPCSSLSTWSASRT